MRALPVLLAGCAAVAAAQLVPALPPRPLAVALLLVGGTVALALLLRRRPTNFWIALLLAVVTGASYAWVRADLRMAQELPREWEGRDIELVGIIDELPQADAQGVRFALAVERVNTPGVAVPPRLAIGWYRTSVRELQGEPLPTLHAGERWQLTVRLKRPHGYANPGGFDVEAWLLENNLRATGSVRNDEPNRLLAGNAGRPVDYLNRLRDRLRERMQQALAGQRFSGVLVALAIGDQRAVSEADWSLFNATAVSHLLSISGAHVTLFAGWVAWLVLAAWRRSPLLTAWLPAQQAAALVAAAIAVLYAALAGFEVPAQRTCYMLLTAAFALLMRRNLSPWLILALALAVVLAIDPWAALAVGFWFSFGAVAFLLYVSVGRVGGRPWWQTVLATQAAVTLGLAPLSLALFQQVSLVGPVANAVAIPLVTMVIVPLTLLWLVLPVDGLLLAAHQLMAWLVQGLQWLMTLPAPVWTQHAPPWWTVPLAIAGCAQLLAPRGWPHRWLGALWCAPLFAVTPPHVADGEFRLTVLDIGQGTAAIVQTARHTLVYDTGPRWTESADAGSRLIAPFLRSSATAHIHGLVVSHLDIDHSGGARSLLQSLPVDWMLTSVFADADIVAAAGKRGVNSIACHSGQSWQWDGVRFAVLHPDATSYRDDRLKTNDRSCVIRVDNGRFSALLTADIEALSERALVARYQDRPTWLRSDVLLMPHHGSLTSSTPALIDAVQPTLALINAGYRNRFGHPRDAVLARYRDRGIAVHRTDWHGAITLDSRTGVEAVTRERDVRQRYWLDRPDPGDRRALD